LVNITRLANALDVSLAKLFAELSGRFHTPPIRHR
jgi:hypothetical protein